MEMICKLLEVFLNKYFFNTVFLIFVTLLMNIILPNSYWMIEKLELLRLEYLYFVLFFHFLTQFLKSMKCLENGEINKSR